MNAFNSFGIPKKNIFCDKKSGKDFERKNYLRLIRKLKHGDLLVIKSIDRLGRNYQMIIDEWSRITNKIQADILVLDMPLLDTRSKANTLVGKFISDIVLQVLSFVAENERENTALVRRKVLRRKEKRRPLRTPPKTHSQNFFEIMFSYENKEISLQQALTLTGMSQSNFYYHFNKCKNLKT